MTMCTSMPYSRAVDHGRRGEDSDRAAGCHIAVGGARSIGAALRPGRTASAPTNPAQDLSRIKAEVGYEPEYTLETGVAAYIEWLRSNPQ